MLSISELQFFDAIDDLRQLVSFPSISNAEDPEYHPKNLQNAADWVIEKLKS